ncbi:hypothetical protein DLAC_02336 [Tieghemostelium lacteum]|uniref:Histone-lysine N-methyltransferase n=1 Tax=Tieghemostelium lacteum TaxID=361077 RepID=A0A152A4S1_TIELA|nr:hypothetical protein DLAC_02336 [Tieghemostelium lacteum]|eukprot:KYR01218.1 hypothetical protein DLAC_02336 [Tieghemostelium lacteum]
MVSEHNVSLLDLINYGLLAVNTQVRYNYRGVQYLAKISVNGEILTTDGNSYINPTHWTRTVSGNNCSGWGTVKVSPDGIPLLNLKREYLMAVNGTISKSTAPRITTPIKKSNNNNNNNNNNNEDIEDINEDISNNNNNNNHNQEESDDYNNINSNKKLNTPEPTTPQHTSTTTITTTTRKKNKIKHKSESSMNNRNNNNNSNNISIENSQSLVHILPNNYQQQQNVSPTSSASSPSNSSHDSPSSQNTIINHLHYHQNSAANSNSNNNNNNSNNGSHYSHPASSFYYYHHLHPPGVHHGGFLSHLQQSNTPSSPTTSIIPILYNITPAHNIPSHHPSHHPHIQQAPLPSYTSYHISGYPHSSVMDGSQPPIPLLPFNQQNNHHHHHPTPHQQSSHHNNNYIHHNHHQSNSHSPYHDNTCNNNPNTFKSSNNHERLTNSNAHSPYQQHQSVIPPHILQQQQQHHHHHHHQQQQAYNQQYSPIIDHISAPDGYHYSEIEANIGQIPLTPITPTLSLPYNLYPSPLYSLPNLTPQHIEAMLDDKDHSHLQSSIPHYIIQQQQQLHSQSSPNNSNNTPTTTTTTTTSNNSQPTSLQISGMLQSSLNSYTYPTIPFQKSPRAVLNSPPIFAQSTTLQSNSTAPLPIYQQPNINPNSPLLYQQHQSHLINSPRKDYKHPQQQQQQQQQVQQYSQTSQHDKKRKSENNTPSTISERIGESRESNFYDIENNVRKKFKGKNINHLHHHLHHQSSSTSSSPSSTTTSTLSYDNLRNVRQEDKSSTTTSEEEETEETANNSTSGNSSKINIGEMNYYNGSSVRIAYLNDDSVWFESCKICGSFDQDRLLFCYDCGEGYHYYCLRVNIPEDNLDYIEVWRCPQCRLCELCQYRLVDNEDTLLSCFNCDRPYHKTCLLKSDILTRQCPCYKEIEIERQLGNKMEVDKDIDQRPCVLCLKKGDLSKCEGRLIPFGIDSWVHLNCIYFSSDLVISGSDSNVLINPLKILQKSKFTKCSTCKKKGATLECCECKVAFHFPCALSDKCYINQIDRKVYCRKHCTPTSTTQPFQNNRVIQLYGNVMDIKGKLSNMITSPSNSQGQPLDIKDGFISLFSLDRNDENIQYHYKLKIGSLRLESIGEVIYENDQFYSTDMIFPVGYIAIRKYWSLFDMNERIDYLCKIVNENDRPCFYIQVLQWSESTQQESYLLNLKSQNIMELGQEFRERFTTIRSTKRPLKLDIYWFFGLTDPFVHSFIEYMPLSRRCSNYKRQYVYTETGCARSKPLGVVRALGTSQDKILIKHVQKKKNRVSLSKSVNVVQFERSIANGLKIYHEMQESKQSNIYIKLSSIHSYGGFAKRDLKDGDFITEYIGEIIRQKIADIREKQYQDKGIDCFMFRVDSDCIVDATKRGNRARFINHSCDPNAKTRIVTIGNLQKIIIVAIKDIKKDQEILYDYCFQQEPDENRVPCHCGTPICRGFLN